MKKLTDTWKQKKMGSSQQSGKAPGYPLSIQSTDTPGSGRRFLGRLPVKNPAKPGSGKQMSSGISGAKENIPTPCTSMDLSLGSSFGDLDVDMMSAIDKIEKDHIIEEKCEKGLFRNVLSPSGPNSTAGIRHSPRLQGKRVSYHQNQKNTPKTKTMQCQKPYSKKSTKSPVNSCVSTTNTPLRRKSNCVSSTTSTPVTREVINSTNTPAVNLSMESPQYKSTPQEASPVITLNMLNEAVISRDINNEQQLVRTLFTNDLSAAEACTEPSPKTTDLQVLCQDSINSEAEKSVISNKPASNTIQTVIPAPKSDDLSNTTNNQTTDSVNYSHQQVSCVGKISVAEGEDRLSLSSWGLPEVVLQRYTESGITRMFDWQAECLMTGHVLVQPFLRRRRLNDFLNFGSHSLENYTGGNLVYSAPTSAGKTIVAELLILKRVLETKKKAIIILPFVSVSREKMFYLQYLYQDAGIKVGGFMGSHSPAGGLHAVDVAVCTIEKANSLINRLLQENALDVLGIVVVDELHMIGDSHRGYLLELLLTKINFVSKKSVASKKPEGVSDVTPETNPVQIIGMSATLPNLDMLANWLSADLYKTDFRPVPLSEHVKIGQIMYDSQMKKIRDFNPSLKFKGDDECVIPLCLETILDRCSVLIFCPSKNWCEKLAESIAREFYDLLRNPARLQQQQGFVKASSLLQLPIDKRAVEDVLEQLRRTPIGLDPILGRLVANGVAYHHAGLTFDERDIVEGAFRQGVLKVLVATSTLSSGVNLPARRVIIRTPSFLGGTIDTLTYKQMVGRAGRKGVDIAGESVLVCKQNERNKAVTLVKSALPPVRSCLIKNQGEQLSSSMKRAILEVVVSGVASSPSEVTAYASCTMLASSLQVEGEQNSDNVILACLQFLQTNEFVTLQSATNNEGVKEDRFYPTQLGSAVLASSLAPDEGLLVFAELQRARQCFVLENELHIIYQVTPIYAYDLGANIDWFNFLSMWEKLTPGMRRVAELVGVQESYIARGIRGNVQTRTAKQAQQAAVHRRFYTCLVLHDLVNEMSLSDVCRKYNCNRGQLQSLQQSAASFAGMVTVFCSRLGWLNLELILGQFQSRLTFGIQRELCDLVRISVLNGQRARVMFNGGFHTMAALANADPVHLENLLRNSAPFQSKKRLDGESEWEVKQRQNARCIWLTGKKGVTELEAAQAIISEAKSLVEEDLGGIGIQWSTNAATSVKPSSKHQAQTTRHSNSLYTSPKSKKESVVVVTPPGSREAVILRNKKQNSESNLANGKEVSEQSKPSAVKANGKEVSEQSKPSVVKPNPCLTVLGKDIPKAPETATSNEESLEQVDHNCKPDSVIKSTKVVGNILSSACDNNKSIKHNYNVKHESHNRCVDGDIKSSSSCSSHKLKAGQSEMKTKPTKITLNVNADVHTSSSGRQVYNGQNNAIIVQKIKQTGVVNKCNKTSAAKVSRPDCEDENSEIVVISTTTERKEKVTEKVNVENPNVQQITNLKVSDQVSANEIVDVDDALTSKHLVKAVPQKPTSDTKRDSSPNYQRLSLQSNVTSPELYTNQDDFSDSFVIDTQTVQMFNQNLSGKEEKSPYSISTCNDKKQCDLSPKGYNGRSNTDVFRIPIAGQKSKMSGADLKSKTENPALKAVVKSNDSDSIVIEQINTRCSKNGTSAIKGSTAKQDDSTADHQRPTFSKAVDPILEVLNIPAQHNYHKEDEDTKAIMGPKTEVDGLNVPGQQDMTSPLLYSEQVSFDESLSCGQGTIAVNLAADSPISQAEDSMFDSPGEQDGLDLGIVCSQDNTSYSLMPASCFGNRSSYGIDLTASESYSNLNIHEPSKRQGRKSIHSQRHDKGMVGLVDNPVNETSPKVSNTYRQMQKDMEGMDFECSFSDLTSPSQKNSAQNRIAEKQEMSQPEFGNSLTMSMLEKVLDDNNTFMGSNVNISERTAIKSTKRVQLDTKSKLEMSSSTELKTAKGKGNNNAAVSKQDEAKSRLKRRSNEKTPPEPFAANKVSRTSPFNTSVSPQNVSAGSDFVPPTPPDENTSKVDSPRIHVSKTPRRSFHCKKRVEEATPEGKKGTTRLRTDIFQEEKADNKAVPTKQKDTSIKSKPSFIMSRPKGNHSTQKKLNPKSPTKQPSGGLANTLSCKSDQQQIDDQETIKTTLNGQFSSRNSRLSSNMRTQLKAQAVEENHNNVVDELFEEAVVDDMNNDNNGDDNDDLWSLRMTCSQSPVINNTQSLFTLIDVCANKDVFQTFLQEWKSQRRFSLCVACEEKPPPVVIPGAGIGGKYLKAQTGVPEVAQTVDGVDIPGSDLVIVGVAVCWENRDTYYISLSDNTDQAGIDDSFAPPPLDECISLSDRLCCIRSVLNCCPRRKAFGPCVVTFDIKEQYKALAQGFGVTYLAEVQDPKVACWVMDPGAKERPLHRLVHNLLPSEVHLLEGLGGGIGVGSLGLTPRNPGSGRYRAATESVLTLHLMDQLLEGLKAQNLFQAFQTVEMPSVITLARMELNGFGFSDVECESQTSVMQAKLSAIEQDAYQLAGHTFSLTSTDDIVQVLYFQLKLPPNGDPSSISTTKTLGPSRRTGFGARRNGRGKPQLSTSKDILEKLKSFHPLPGLILEWRRISNAITKSVFPLQREKVFCKRVNMYRIFGESSYHTATGRVTMSEPNIQNIPKDFEISLPGIIGESPPTGCGRQGWNGPKSRGGRGVVCPKQTSRMSTINQPGTPFAVSMRHAFVPFKGGVMLAADYSQLELRMLAHLSGDAKLTRILNSDADVFKMIASQWKNLPVNEITPEQRQHAKQVCYGMLYGIGPKALSEQLGVEEPDASVFIETFKSKYTGMRRFIRETIEKCKKNGYVETLLHRKRYLPAITDTNPHARAHAERQAVNTTVQGSAADLVKTAMIRIDEALIKHFPLSINTHKHCLTQDLTGKQKSSPSKISGAYLVLQLHDELIYEVGEENASEMMSLVRHHMEHAIKLSVKFPVKVKLGHSWGKLEEAN